jgi:hypothetical protein
MLLKEVVEGVDTLLMGLEDVVIIDELYFKIFDRLMIFINMI